MRLSFIPTLTPRGTVRLEKAPEVSALDYTNGLVFQGFTIPALTVRRVHTDIELEPVQRFGIGGLIDRRTTETFSKIPGLGDIPILGKMFQSKSIQRDNEEVLILATPQLVRPIRAGQALPELKYPVTCPRPSPRHNRATRGLAPPGRCR